MRSKLIFLLTSAALISSWSYTIIFAKDLGLNEVQIGTVVFAYFFTQFFSFYFFGRASDILGRKILILIGLLASSVSLFLQVFAFDYFSLLLFRMLVGLSSGIFPSALVAYVHEKGEKIGKFVSFSSLGWFFGLLSAGFVALRFSVKGVFFLSSLLCFMTIPAAIGLKEKGFKSIKVPFFPVKFLKKNKSIFISYLLRHVGAHLIWTFWPLYLKELGANLFWVGGVQAVNSLTQFIVMFSIVDKFNPSYLFPFGTILSSITFFSFTLATNFWQIIPTQVLLGFSWSFMYVGALRLLLRMSKEKATVSGLLGSTFSISAIIGPSLATFMIAFFDFRFCMYFASFLAFLSFLYYRASKSKS